jgi:hypothetical protein
MMTPERFRALLESYGSDPRRWPEAERADALALMEQDTPEIRQWLGEAAAMDAWLESETVAAPSEQLIQRALAAAAQGAKPAHRREAWWWWPSAGLAGAGLAGSFAGAFAMSVALRVATPPTGPEWPERSTAFTEVPADWSEE